MKFSKVTKATVSGGSVRLMTALVLTMFFVSLLSLNSYADAGKDLIDAAKREDISSVKELLDKGADVNTKDEDGGTALMLASQYGYTEIARTLIDKGVDVNAQDKVGLTALMLASLNGHTKIVKELLDKGADMNAKNKRGATALMLASQYGYTEIAKALLDRGAVVSANDSKGETHLYQRMFTVLIKKSPFTCSAVFDKFDSFYFGSRLPFLYGGTGVEFRRSSDPGLKGFHRIEHTCPSSTRGGLEDNLFKILRNLMPRIPDAESSNKIIEFIFIKDGEEGIGTTVTGLLFPIPNKSIIVDIECNAVSGDGGSYHFICPEMR